MDKNEPLQQYVARLTGLTGKQLSLRPRPALDVQSNRLYDVSSPYGHWIVKEFLKPDEFESSPWREYRALQRLASLDIAPQPIGFAPHTDTWRPLVIYEYMPGQMWGRHRPAAADLRRLAALWRRLADLPVADFWPARTARNESHKIAELLAGYRTRFDNYAAWAQDHFPASRPAADRCLHLLERALPAVRELDNCRPQLCFCRSDPRFANIIARPDGRLGLVDWEDCGLRDPALELADWAVHANQEDLLTAGDCAFFQAHFLAGHPPDPGLPHRVALYRLLLTVFWLTIFVDLGRRRWQEGAAAPWLIHDLPANQKLRRYLARGLAWPDGDLNGQLAETADLHFFP